MDKSISFKVNFIGRYHVPLNIHIFQCDNLEFYIFFVHRTKTEARARLIANGFIESQETEEGEVSLHQNHFKWDKICPLFVSCIPLDRSDFAKTSLMMDSQFIMQARFVYISSIIALG